MPDPRMLLRDRPRQHCSRCGRPHLLPAEREDIEARGIDVPEGAEEGAWGFARCAHCGHLEQVEP